MRAGHTANAKRYDQIVDELAASESAIHRLQGSSNDDAEQYKFLQEMRGYVGDLLECFGEKVRDEFAVVLRFPPPFFKIFFFFLLPFVLGFCLVKATR